MPAANDKNLGEMLVGSRPRLFAYVRRRVGDRDTTNEILQEVSLRALAGDGPRDSAAFLAWIFGIARHVIALEWRRRRRLRAEQPIEDPAVEEIHDPVASPDRLVDARVSLERAFGVDRESIALLVRRYLGNASGKQLASELGLSPAALRMRLMRIRLLVRARQ